MSIKTVHDSLESGQRKILAADRERWKHMGAGAHLSDWLAFLPGMLLRQEMALRIAGTNRREGKGYTGALSALMMRDGLYDSTTVTQPAKESFGAVLWFGVKNHRMEILQEILRDMTPGQRARFNSPITARQRVKKIAVERELEEAPKQRAVKPPKDDAAKALSDQARDLEGENEHSREQLAAAESAPHREAGAVDLDQARDTYAALLPTRSEARRKELRALVDTVVITVDDITDLRHHLDQRIEAVWGKNRRRTRRTIQEQVAEN
jgi:hypothetical protein